MSDWSDLLHDQVTIEPVTGVDGDGNKTYGAPVTYPCRIAGGIVANRSIEGTERVSRPSVIFDQFVDVSIDARITLISSTIPTQPAIVAVNHYPDENGDKFTVIVL